MVLFFSSLCIQNKGFPPQCSLLYTCTHTHTKQWIQPQCWPFVGIRCTPQIRTKVYVVGIGDTNTETLVKYTWCIQKSENHIFWYNTPLAIPMDKLSPDLIQKSHKFGFGFPVCVWSHQNDDNDNTDNDNSTLSPVHLLPNGSSHFFFNGGFQHLLQRGFSHCGRLVSQPGGVWVIYI